MQRKHQKIPNLFPKINRFEVYFDPFHRQQKDGLLLPKWQFCDHDILANLFP